LLMNTKNSNAQTWNPLDSSYHMGFEKSDSAEFIDNWIAEQDTNYYQASWTIYPDTDCIHTDTFAIGISEYNNYHLFSRPFELKADSTYDIGFWYFVCMPDLPGQNLLVAIGGAQDSASMRDTILNLTDIDNNDYVRAKIIYSAQNDTIMHLS